MCPKRHDMLLISDTSDIMYSTFPYQKKETFLYFWSEIRNVNFCSLLLMVVISSLSLLRLLCACYSFYVSEAKLARIFSYSPSFLPMIDVETQSFFLLFTNLYSNLEMNIMRSHQTSSSLYVFLFFYSRDGKSYDLFDKIKIHAQICKKPNFFCKEETLTRAK